MKKVEASDKFLKCLKNYFENEEKLNKIFELGAQNKLNPQISKELNKNITDSKKKK